ncbi:MAG: hypothetical protein CBCREVIR_0039 [Candidatus Burkholderia crenata]|nr:MAG: hypothetical protein CBCREVIR_0039 [Candidatus Burkholderia crenata]
MLSWTPEHPEPVHTVKKRRSQAMTGTARKRGACHSNATRHAMRMTRCNDTKLRREARSCSRIGFRSGVGFNASLRYFPPLSFLRP